MAWYKCNIIHNTTDADGQVREDVKEPYVMQADSVTEAAARLAAHLEGETYALDGVTRMHLQEIFLDTEADTYYLAKVALITLDEVTGSERRQTIRCLIEADFLRSALEILEKHGMDSDWELLSLSKTPIVEVVTEKSKEGAAA
jgi:hypothetical protein